MADGEEDFECWLNGKLRALNTDEGVFGTYIKGILEGEETLDDKTEALEGILSEITEEDIPKHCREILERWQKISQALNTSSKSEPEEDVEVKLVRLLESQSLPTVAPKSYTEEERKIREAILAQYSQMSDNEEDEGTDNRADGGGGGVVSSGTSASGGGGGVGGGSGGLMRNTNAEEVHKAEREKRERAKLESQKKKDKDKEDREKQKQLQQERKEKRKTQKGERRR